MPMEKVGWGRVTRDQIETLLRFHPIKFHYENGPDYVNATAAGPLMRRIVKTFDAGSDGPRFALFFGHDTNLADLRALLDIDWKRSEARRVGQACVPRCVYRWSP